MSDLAPPHRRMPRWVAAIFSFGLGTIAGLSVLVWPPTPLWTADFSPPTNAGVTSFFFTEDQRTIYLLHGTPHVGNIPLGIFRDFQDFTEPVLVSWDLASGRQTTECKIGEDLPADGMWHFPRFEVEAAIGAAWCYQVSPENSETNVLFVDWRTGKTVQPRYTIPFAVKHLSLSPDHTLCYAVAEKGKSKSSSVRSIPNGVIMAKLPDDGDIEQTCFSPDNQHLAVLSVQDKFGGAERIVRIFQCTDWTEEWRVTLPPQPSRKFGNLYWTEKLLIRMEDFSPEQFWFMEITPAGLRELSPGPGFRERVVSWKNGGRLPSYTGIDSQCVMIARDRESEVRRAISDLREWLFRTRGAAPDLYRITRTDSQNHAVLGASFVLPGPLEICPYGEYLLSRDSANHRFHAWSMTPPSRGPWAVGVGLITMLLVYHIVGIRARFKPARP